MDSIDARSSARAIRNLQHELAALGWSVDEHERRTSTFGPTTRAAVEDFQRLTGRSVTGIADVETFALIRNCRAALPEGDETGRVLLTRVLEAKASLAIGRVRGEHGQPLAGTVVQLVDRDLRRAESLGKTLTDGLGRWAIGYKARQFARAELR